MEIINGDLKMFIDDIDTYKKFLETNINELNSAAQTRGLSQEEIAKINKYMDLYNQIIDKEREETKPVKHNL